MKNFVQTGDILTLTAPYTVTSGSGTLVGTVFGVACDDVTSGASGQYKTTGVFDLAKAAVAFSAADRVYWDNSAKNCTNVAAGNTFIGRATQAQLSGDATVRVLLNQSSPRKLFVSTTQTGNGSPQNVAHGLGVVPAAVVAIPQDGGTTGFTYGTHTSTNCVITATNTAKYIVVAWPEA
jgi:predicted RecA/RadA family phage recombinase